MSNWIAATKGGVGSGNFGHSGRPGEVGGSAVSSNGKRIQAYRDFAKKHNNKSFEVGSVLNENGEILIRDVVDTDNDDLSITMNRDTERRLKGNNFIHNHPEGSSLSSSDIKYAMLMDMKSITATSSFGIYTMSFNNIDQSNEIQTKYGVAIRNIDENIFNNFTKAIKENQMTNKEAELQHFDTLWIEFIKEFPNDGFVYTSIPFKDTR